ncbi:hypothetical protein KL933_000231 [Ogataea haglerorum]|uniref:Uncharacterized protein n=1 Tax=Ogataea haglerorum TaxID=1937702 RepID=A0AAN6D9I9_9ASCO|nr:uncharacterized protein KL911_001318 [Ogataea haglerorum]KAG7700421.1 hypothetical protein KL915_001110 [Ogataea haglerorum]KAG7702080.1 hypothetical protein KL951_000536 [Ogataea haglerorum]KAG7711894.1 hypothetical protein KL914_000536 [Ogataea haglerorum]KAG7712665.1 hypothetical protein KL950_000536 [Ogataea haglerorum]KAG7730436.1 hypothetical protein KL933_000231 [Ogataea haglerorum]
MDTKSSSSHHTQIEEELQPPHGSTQKQWTRMIKTNNEGSQTHKSKRAFSFSKFIGSTLQVKNEDSKEFEHSTTVHACVQTPTTQLRSKWIRPFSSFHSLFKTRKKVDSLPEKESTVLTTEFDPQKDAMFSCYDAFKNTEIQTTLNSLKESIDSNLLQKSTIRYIHYRHKDGVGKALTPSIESNNKENREVILRAESDIITLGKIANQMSENGQASHVLASKQTRACDTELLSDRFSAQSMSMSLYEQKNYMAENGTSVNCAPGIYLNSELARLFNCLRQRADHEKSRFYAASDANSHSFPDFEHSSQFGENEVSGESLSEEDSVNGPLSSFIEEPIQESFHFCEHERSQLRSSLRNSYGKSTDHCQAY